MSHSQDDSVSRVRNMEWMLDVGKKRGASTKHRSCKVSTQVRFEDLQDAIHTAVATDDAKALHQLLETAASHFTGFDLKNIGRGLLNKALDDHAAYRCSEWLHYNGIVKHNACCHAGPGSIVLRILRTLVKRMLPLSPLALASGCQFYIRREIYEIWSKSRCCQQLLGVLCNFVLLNEPVCNCILHSWYLVRQYPPLVSLWFEYGFTMRSYDSKPLSGSQSVFSTDPQSNVCINVADLYYKLDLAMSQFHGGMFIDLLLEIPTRRARHTALKTCASRFCPFDYNHVQQNIEVLCFMKSGRYAEVVNRSYVGISDNASLVERYSVLGQYASYAWRRVSSDKRLFDVVFKLAGVAECILHSLPLELLFFLADHLWSQCLIDFIAHQCNMMEYSARLKLLNGVPRQHIF